MNAKQKIVKENLIKAMQYLKVNQKEFAKLLGVPASTLNDWLNQTFNVPFQFAVDIEVLTHNEVDCFDLCLDAAPVIKLLKKASLLQTQNFLDLKISERIEQGILLEEKLKSLRTSSFKHIKTRDIVAKIFGLGSGKNYVKGRDALEKGIPPLRQVLDEKKFSIHLCHQISQLPLEEQPLLITLDKKEALQKINQLKQVNQKYEIPEALIFLLNNQSLKLFEYQQQKPYRIALLGLMVLQCVYQKIPISWPTLEALYQETLQLSLNDCTQTLKQLGCLKQEEHYFQLHFSKEQAYA